jgi:hypothetical protein
MGTNAIEYIKEDVSGRIDCEALEVALKAKVDRPTIVLLQAGRTQHRFV